MIREAVRFEEDSEVIRVRRFISSELFLLIQNTIRENYCLLCCHYIYFNVFRNIGKIERDIRF